MLLSSMVDVLAEKLTPFWSSNGVRQSRFGEKDLMIG
jgi:hypothetical protein